MAVNRCLEPKTKIQIKNWTEETILPRLQREELPGDFEIYRVLDKIADQEESLQQHLYQQHIKFGSLPLITRKSTHHPLALSCVYCCCRLDILSTDHFFQVTGDCPEIMDNSMNH